MLIWEEAEVSDQPLASDVPTRYQIMRRQGAVVAFEPNKVASAVMQAYMGVNSALAFVESVCRAGLCGFWRAIKPSQVVAIAGDRAVRLDRQLRCARQREQYKQRHFFDDTKPDMRNAP